MGFEFDWDAPIQVTQAWGDFIRDRAPWSWWITLTFRTPVSERYAAQTLRTWAQLLARAIHAHFPVAWVIEPHATEGHHVHALLALPVHTLTETHLRTQLHFASPLVGRSTIEPYIVGGGASWYASKTGKCEISVACTRSGSCKRDGCTEGRWPLP